MNYPDDFQKFQGKHLTDREINALLQKTQKSSAMDSWLGDTRITITEDGYCQVWELKADYEPQVDSPLEV